MNRGRYLAALPLLAALLTGCSSDRFVEQPLRDEDGPAVDSGADRDPDPLDGGVGDGPDPYSG